jgi:hypothetical protein
MWWWYTLDRGLGRPQRWSGHSEEEKKALPYQKYNSGYPSHSLVTVLTDLSWLF